MRKLAILSVIAVLSGACSDDSGGTDDTGTGPDTGGNLDNGLVADGGPDQGAHDAGPGKDKFVWPDKGGDSGPAVAATIPNIQTSVVKDGAKVLLKDVVVTAVDGYGTYTGNVYVQESAGGANSGILLYNPKRSDSGKISDLTPGDHVKVEGMVKHYTPSSPFPGGKKMIELVSATLSKISTGTDPAPKVLTTTDLTTAATVAKWEHVLVTVKDVKVTAAADAKYNEFTISGGFKVDDELYPHTPKLGDCISITAVLGYFYSYKLFPRSAADITTSTGCGATPTLTIKDLQDTTSTSHPATGTQVKVSGVITAVDAAVSSTGNYTGFFIQDSAGGPYSGIFVNHTWTASATQKPLLNDLVDLTGTYDEVSGLSQLKNVTWTSKGVVSTPPQPVTVAAADIATTGTKNEMYEGVLVETTSVVVSSIVQDSKLKNVAFKDSTSGLIVDIMLYDFLNPTPPAVGTKYLKVTGPLHYMFSDFRILPRSAADLSK